MKTRQSFIQTDFITKEEENEKVLEGYFIRFNQKTELWDNVWEVVEENAIQNLESDIRALFNHDTSLVLGRTQNGTLELEVDSLGLRGRIKINEEDPQAMGAYARVKRGDVVGCSFGFRILEEEVQELAGATLFVIKSLELFEVSPCTFPAYPQTEIHARQRDLSQFKSKVLEAKKEKLKERFQCQKS